MRAVQIRIDALVVDSTARVSPDELGRAVEVQLAQLVARRGLPTGLRDRDAATVNVVAGAENASALARAIYRGLCG